MQCGHARECHGPEERPNCTAKIGADGSVSAGCRCRRFVDWQAMRGRYARKHKRLRDGILSLAYHRGRLVDEGKPEEAAALAAHLLAATIAFYKNSKNIQALDSVKPKEAA